MKKNILLFIFLAIVLDLAAQQTDSTNTNSVLSVTQKVEPRFRKRTVLAISPLGLITKVKLRYEQILTTRFSVGASLSGYYWIFKGVQFEPYVRSYFAPNAPAGFYLQGQAGLYYHLTPTGVTTTKNKNYFSGAGIGAGLGHQWLLGRRKRLIMDIMVGLKYYPLPAINESSNFIRPDVTHKSLWYLTGPGSVYNGTIALGFAW